MIKTIRARLGAAALLVAAGAAAAWAAGEAVHIDRQKWTFGGVFGHFDDAQLQRGFKVYTEACARWARLASLMPLPRLTIGVYIGPGQMQLTRM